MKAENLSFQPRVLTFTTRLKCLNSEHLPPFLIRFHSSIFCNNEIRIRTHNPTVSPIKQYEGLYIVLKVMKAASKWKMAD